MTRSIIKKLFIEENIKICYDETQNKLSHFLRENEILILGNNGRISQGVGKILEEFGGKICFRLDKNHIIRKYVHISDINDYYDMRAIEEKWDFDLEVLKQTFFSIQKFAAQCEENKIHGTILDILIVRSNEDAALEPFKAMIEGFGKCLGNRRIRANMIILTNEMLEYSNGSIAFLLSEHSNHINGICLTIDKEQPKL